MAASVTLSFSSDSILAPVGKNGKVSTNNAKAAKLLNASDKLTLVSAALTSKGAVGKVAKSAILAHVQSLHTMLSLDSIDGSQWGNLLTLLVGEFGVAQFSRSSMRGRDGCVKYLESVQSLAVSKFNKAETTKQQESAIAAIAAIEQASANVARLVTASEVARMQAEQETTAQETTAQETTAQETTAQETV